MKPLLKYASESSRPPAAARVDSSGGIAPSVTVTTRDGKAILTGTVRSWQERRRAEHAVWASPDVRELDDRLMVVPE